MESSQGTYKMTGKRKRKIDPEIRRRLRRERDRKNRESRRRKGQELWEASRNGQIDVIQNLLNSSRSNRIVVNFKERSSETTPLHEASRIGHTALMELLLSHGAQTEVEDGGGSTALVLATQQGHTEAAEVLLRHGANIEAKDDNGDTPLILASYNGHTAAMKVLLRHGAEVNAKANHGDTALILASQNGHTEAMEVLLGHGAYVDAEGNLGYTSLAWAITNLFIGAVEILIRHGAQVDSKICDQDIALIQAIRNWDVSAMGDWLSRTRHRDHTKRVSSYKHYQQGETLLRWAMTTRRHDYHFMKLLLQNGAEIEARDHHGMTLLALASQRGQAEAVKILLDRGASIHVQDPSGRTPLDHAFLYLTSHTTNKYDIRRGLSTVHLLLKSTFM